MRTFPRICRGQKVQSWTPTSPSRQSPTRASRPLRLRRRGRCSERARSTRSRCTLRGRPPWSPCTAPRRKRHPRPNEFQSSPPRTRGREAGRGADREGRAGRAEGTEAETGAGRTEAPAAGEEKTEAAAGPEAAAERKAGGREEEPEAETQAEQKADGHKCSSGTSARRSGFRRRSSTCVRRWSTGTRSPCCRWSQALNLRRQRSRPGSSPRRGPSASTWSAGSCFRTAFPSRRSGPSWPQTGYRL